MNTIERLDRIEELQHEADVIVQIMNTFNGSKEQLHDTLNEIRIELPKAPEVFKLARLTG